MVGSAGGTKSAKKLQVKSVTAALSCVHRIISIFDGSGYGLEEDYIRGLPKPCATALLSMASFVWKNTTAENTK